MFEHPYLVFSDGLHLHGNVAIDLRLRVFQGEVFHLGFEIVQPQTVRYGRVDEQCFRSDLHLFVRRHALQCAHIVQTVGQLDEYHAHILPKGQDHFAEILCLLGRVGIEYIGDLGETVHDPCDLFSK